ncbi:MAG: hypothetical protein ABFS14_01225 [Gemmatimonadota bacterium]
MAHSRIRSPESYPGWVPILAAVILALSTPASGLAQTAPPVSELGALVQVTTLTDTLEGRVGGVTIDRLGFVYVADFGEQIWKVSPWGDVELLAKTMYGSSGNAVDAQGRVYQANFNANLINRIGRDGTVEQFAAGFRGPVGITFDAAGDLIVCNCQANTLSRVTPAGEVSQFVSSALLNCPNGITLDGQGNFYVVNFSDARMLKITPAGEVSEFATIPGGGNGHVIFAGGEFYVTGFRSNQLYRVTAAGEVSAVAGTGVRSATDGTGDVATFSSPNGITYDPLRDILYVNDLLTPLRGRNTARNKSVVRRIQLPGMTAQFNAALASGGIDAAVAAYHAARAARPGRNTQAQTNALGYQLMGSGQVQDAITVFKLNVEAYPNSFNPYDSLGEGYMTAGETELAIEFYEKSLELNPQNTNAVSKLNELRSQ